MRLGLRDWIRFAGRAEAAIRVLEKGRPPAGGPLSPGGGQPLGSGSSLGPGSEGEEWLSDEVLSDLDVEAAEGHVRRVRGAGEAVDVCPPGERPSSLGAQGCVWRCNI